MPDETTLSLVSTANEVAAIFRMTPRGAETRWLVLARWVELCETPEEIQLALDMSCRNMFKAQGAHCPAGWYDLEDSPLGVKYRNLHTLKPNTEVRRCAEYGRRWPKNIVFRTEK